MPVAMHKQTMPDQFANPPKANTTRKKSTSRKNSDASDQQPNKIINSNEALTQTPIAEGVSINPLTALDGLATIKSKAKDIKTAKGPKAHRFVPGSSHLDISDDSSVRTNTFRGFVNLFWVMMAFHGMAGLAHSQSFPIALPTNDTWHDCVELVVLEVAMFIASLLSVILAKAARILPEDLPGAFRFLYVIGFQIGVTIWVFKRNWPGMIAGFAVLHSLVYTMKIHSYLIVNLDWERAYRELGNAKKDQEDSNVDKVVKTDDDEWEAEFTLSKYYPDNMTLGNFVDFLLVPTLVYEAKYPRTQSIRWQYVSEKLAATLFTIILLYVNSQSFILPTLQKLHQYSLFDSCLQLIAPMLLGYMLVFYAIFECIANLFAELTCFAPRQFYQDWWNATSFDEYARKWNSPVHEFLLRHVYLRSLQSSYGISKRRATFLVFLLSSIYHEIVMSVVSRRLRPWLFLFQMSQLPLIYLGRLRIMRENPRLGNSFFWFGITCGVPLITILYAREIMLA